MTAPHRASVGRVLVADNDTNVSAILREFLVRRGLDVTVVRDGLEALTWLGSERCDVLVLDLDMPLMTGSELLEQLREEARCPPVIVISGYVDVHLERHLLGHPAVLEILRKPFDVRDFAARVVAVAARRGDGAGDPDGAGPTLF